MLTSHQLPVLLHASDDVARAVEDLQFMLGAGPSVDAAATRTPVLVPDTRARTDQTERWPGLCTELDALEVRALFAFPISVGDVSLGTLDLYRSAPGELDDAKVDFCAATGSAIADSLLKRRSDTDWMYPMTVHRAAGMVMVQLSVSVDDALARIRATAYEEGVTVAAVAAEVLDGTRRFREGPA